MKSEQAAFEPACAAAVDCPACDECPAAPFDALAALRASEARFRGLCELSSDWYWEPTNPGSSAQASSWEPTPSE